MRYSVTVLPRAERDVRALFTYLANRSSTGAAAWAKAFQLALSRLEHTADGCPKAAESELMDLDVRELMFRTRRGLTYRVLFTIEGQRVFVMHVRGPGQDFLSAEEITPHDPL